MILDNTQRKPEECKSNDVTCSQTSRKRMLPDITNSLSNTDIVHDYITPKKTKRLKQRLRYIPENEMSKEELKQWRAQQRKLRNRQSAAASRQKIRNHVEKLEQQVELLQQKYEMVLNRLQQYEPHVNDDNLYHVPNGVVSVHTPSVISDVSIETATPSAMPITSDGIALDLQATNHEPGLVDEYPPMNKTDMNNANDDEDLREFLRYAFSENEQV